MKTVTRASLWTALIIGVLGVVVVGSNVIAARQARKLGLEDEGVVHASANSRRIRAIQSTTAVWPKSEHRSDRRIVGPVLGTAGRD